MFADRDSVGHFAVRWRDLLSGSPEALFRILVATVMFQRRQDQQILRILRGLTKEQVSELTTPATLLSQAREVRCRHSKSLTSLITACDLGKDPASGRGTCGQRPRTACQLKLHTVWLKRYGHFGKVPTSLALVLHERGHQDLGGLRDQVLREAESPGEAAEGLLSALSDGWRVSDKIAHMFLSLLTNPDFYPGDRPPWIEGVDWTHFVVVDSNVDLFLEAIGYPGPWTYSARWSFVRALAERIDLSALDGRVQPFNPRLLQQALYLFMSRTNRLALERDCSKRGACDECPGALRTICPSADSGS